MPGVERNDLGRGALAALAADSVSVGRMALAGGGLQVTCAGLVAPLAFATRGCVLDDAVQVAFVRSEPVPGRSFAFASAFAFGAGFGESETAAGYLLGPAFKLASYRTSCL